MDDYERYQAITLADLPDGQHVLAWENENTATYYYRSGGVSHKVVYHKTVRAVMDANAEAAKEFSRTGKIKNNTLVSSMPTSVYLDLHAKGIAQDDGEYRKFLNHSDNSGFRTNNLRV